MINNSVPHNFKSSDELKAELRVLREEQEELRIKIKQQRMVDNPDEGALSRLKDKAKEYVNDWDNGRTRNIGLIEAKVREIAQQERRESKSNNPSVVFVGGVEVEVGSLKKGDRWVILKVTAKRLYVLELNSLRERYVPLTRKGNSTYYPKEQIDIPRSIAKWYEHVLYK